MTRFAAIAAATVLACGFSTIPAFAGDVSNGLVLNGMSINGPVLNGISVNGPVLQGMRMNGALLQGLSFNGTQADAAAAPVLRALTLADGTTLATE